MVWTIDGLTIPPIAGAGAEALFCGEVRTTGHPSYCQRHAARSIALSAAVRPGPFWNARWWRAATAWCSRSTYHPIADRRNRLWTSSPPPRWPTPPRTESPSNGAFTWGLARPARFPYVPAPSIPWPRMDAWRLALLQDGPFQTGTAYTGHHTDTARRFP